MFIHLVTIWQGSWAGSAALYMQVEYCSTVTVLAWCSVHQFPGRECTVKPSCIRLGCIYAVYIGIYGHMQQYIYEIGLYIYYISIYRS